MLASQNLSAELIQPSSVEINESSRLQEIVCDTKRIIGRCALIVSLAASSALAINTTGAVLAPSRAEAATTFTNDYPDMDAVDCSGTYGQYSWCKGTPNTPHSPRGYDYRNCTDGVDYWVKKYTGVDVAGWGNANTWNTSAANARYTVYNGNTNNIEPGDIAQDDTGTYGHVGLVTDVVKDSNETVTSIIVAELNKDTHGDYSHDTYTSKDTSGNFIRNGGGKVWNHFIDVNGVGKGLNNEDIGGTGSGNLIDGTFIKINESGAIYRMVGGAPIRIYNQGALPDFNGTVTNISNDRLGQLPRFPNDTGAIIDISEAGGAKYRFVGGAPVRIYNCGALPGNCNGAIKVNFQSLAMGDHMLSRPHDGAVINIAEAGGSGIYEFVGGAPIRQFNWGAIPNFGPAIDVNIDSLTNYDHMNTRPADGSAVSIVEAGGAGIYRFVGGAPIRLYNWGAIPDMPNVVNINSQSLTVSDHMNTRPSDGSVINIVEAGGTGIYEFVGGAPLRLYNWGPIIGSHMAVGVNFESLAELDHMNAVPNNGEFIASQETGLVYRVAGGDPLRLYNQGCIPGYNGAITVNQQTLDTYDHLNQTPVDGTIVEGVSSQTYWQIVSGKRTQVGPQSNAVVVDEQTIMSLPVGP